MYEKLYMSNGEDEKRCRETQTCSKRYDEGKIYVEKRNEIK